MISLEYQNANEETFKPERVVEETKSILHSNLSSSTKNKKRSLRETETKSKSYHIVTRSTGQNKKSKSLFTERKAEGKQISWGNISVAAKTNRRDSIDKCKSDRLVQRSCTL
jgi:septation ring formation regulator EzrA